MARKKGLCPELTTRAGPVELTATAPPGGPAARALARDRRSTMALAPRRAYGPRWPSIAK
jgi:hypothetical protein